MNKKKIIILLLNFCLIQISKAYIYDINKFIQEIEYLAIPSQKKIALIFGITGQDGSYLTPFLLDKGYFVVGTIRRSSFNNNERLESFFKKDEYKFNLSFVDGDITDYSFVNNLINSLKPDEIYNLSAQSHVKVSFDKPILTAQVNAIGTLNILEVIKNSGLIKKIKVYQASSSEIFGAPRTYPQDESTSFHPRSPYGNSKLFSYWACINYREAYGLFVSNGICYNHESPLRGDDFVTKIITKGVAKIKLGLQDKITIGNLNSKRDWGYAKDYIEAMWLMLQQDKPDDFILSTGELHSVREFIELAFKEVNIDITWQGQGINEIGLNDKTGKILVTVEPRYFRPIETETLLGNSSKAYKTFGWKPKTNFKELVRIMVQSDLKEIEYKKYCSQEK